jgi:hypothetical protein
VRHDLLTFHKRSDSLLSIFPVEDNGEAFVYAMYRGEWQGGTRGEVDAVPSISRPFGTNVAGNPLYASNSVI